MTDTLIKEISEVEGINLFEKIKTFEKKLKGCFKLYDTKEGFEDYKMSDTDYVILYTIWKILNMKDCIEAYLIIMYSYYKLEDFHFPTSKFCINGVYEIIKQTNIIKIINIYIK